MIQLLIFYCLIFTLVPMLTVFNSVQKMRSGKSIVKPAPESDRGNIEGLAVSYQIFLKKHEFKFIGSFRYEKVRVAIWKQNISDEPQRFFILTQENIPEFAAQFNEETTLTSCGHNFAFMYPRPQGSFIQSKDTKQIEQLWQYHTQGEQFLIERFSIEISQISPIRIEEKLSQWLVNQGTYISKIPFYWVYAPYWFYIKRFKMFNVSIQKQFDAGGK
jgi:hypothetical protein